MNRINIVNKLICFIFISFASHIEAQKNSISEIDSLQKRISEGYWNIGNYKKGAILQREVIEKSKKIKYKKGEIKGYIEFSKYCFVMNMYKQGYYLLNIAEQNLKYYDDKSLKSRLYFVYGMSEARLGLHKQAIIDLNKSLDFAYKITDKNLAEKSKQDAYDWKRFSFESLNQMDSVYSCEKKCMAAPRPMLYITIAQRHLKKGRMDSAKYFIDKANDIMLSSKGTVEAKCNVLRAYGELYIERKEYQKSLQYLLKSLKISIRMRFKKREKECYKLISQAYRGKNDLKNENEYLLKYSAVNDSLNLIERAMIDIPIDKLLQEKIQNSEKSKSRLYYIILSIMFVCLCIVIILKRNSKSKKDKIRSNLVQKEKELDLLNKKLDENKEHLLYLATKNDPTFIIKFKELYYDFYTEITTEYPQLNINDMRFIAFVKLSFCNKEIATYTSVSLRTVESKKYRIRKKLNLDVNIDFNDWINSR
ncbi:hypothetical protein [Chryseobacterium viscerum]|uniref:HTH luxR-type domain-containing protein n=1 Tax=Chryseobacterium viscerum TaxID=1037377 RepID=A0A316W9C3_9FLAO|nr:hypothetical protein [Chryseobacterium viscerum]PWN57557.1 hypothetical protein C1634_025525 [Chryseobacterium viscerum]